MRERDRYTELKEYPEWSDFRQEPLHSNDVIRNAGYKKNLWTYHNGYVFTMYRDNTRNKCFLDYREVILTEDTKWYWRSTEIKKVDKAIDLPILVMEDLL